VALAPPDYASCRNATLADDIFAAFLRIHSLKMTVDGNTLQSTKQRNAGRVITVRCNVMMLY